MQANICHLANLRKRNAQTGNFLLRLSKHYERGVFTEKIKSLKKENEDRR